MREPFSEDIFSQMSPKCTDTWIIPQFSPKNCSKNESTQRANTRCRTARSHLLIPRLTRSNPTNPFSRCLPLILQISTPLCDREAIMCGRFYLCVWGPLLYLGFSVLRCIASFDVSCHAQIDDVFAFLPCKLLHNTSKPCSPQIPLWDQSIKAQQAPDF